MLLFNFKGKGLKPFNLGWWKPTQEQWAPVLLEDQKLPWRQQSDPTTGRPWQRLTAKYAAWKSKRYPGEPILRATGKMQDSAKILPKGKGFEVKSTRYGGYHQFGTSKMAARPWVGIPDKSLVQLSQISWKNILSSKS